jgi:beta-glucosidase
VVSAANYRGGTLAAESLASAFGTGLAVAARGIQGAQVQVQDSAGVVRTAAVLYASAGQVNFQIPAGTANGAATVTVQSADGSVSAGNVNIGLVSPGLFTADGSGSGVPAALVVVARSDGSQTVSPVYQCGSGGCTAMAIDLGGPLDQAVLELFGTGIRGRSSASNVTCTIGGTNAPVPYAGAQPNYLGLDQVNVALARTLVGQGAVDVRLIVDGQPANTVSITIPAPSPSVRAGQIVSQMTLGEKIQELHGIQDANDYRTVPGVPRLGIPALNITNGPAGVANGGPGHQGAATALPAPICLAATWDIGFAKLYGGIIGVEAKDLANGFVEGPDINMARVPQNGRNFEAFGEDPYLVSQMAVNEVEGIQGQGVIAEVKHYAGNNQETNRTTINAIIDERTLREIYLPAFEAAVKQGGVGAVMCAYNQVNGAYSCENDVLLNQILKSEWGFDGFVTSDFGAVHSTVASAKAGLDVEMPTGIYFTSALQAAVQSGQVAMAVIDDKLTRRFRTMMRLGVFDTPPANQPLPAQQNGAAARQIAEAGMVLLKNTAGLLPLDAGGLDSIAVVGPYAGKAKTGGGGSSQVTPLYTVDPIPGIQNRAGAAVTVRYADGSNIAQAVALAQAADVAIVMVGDDETEGSDHALSLSGNQDQLVQAVAAANQRTAVVIKSGAPVLMPWVNSVPAILEAWYPGEEDGNAVAAVLFGDVNPSGKLPVTFPQAVGDLPANTPAQYPGVNGQETYSEGVLVGYRYFDAKNIQPLFPFGHGLSYTTFSYANLAIGPAGQSVDFDVTNTGSVAGTEVAQIYIGMPAAGVPQPPKQLKGFQKLTLQPGRTGHVHLSLDQRAFSYWDTGTHTWQVAPGTYQIMAGSSSRDIRLQTQVTVN